MKKREIDSKETGHNDNDTDAFLEAVADVKRLRRPNLADPASGRKAPEKPSAKVGEDGVGQESYFIAAGIQKDVLRKLRTGQLPIEAELDLHGYTVKDAEQVLRNFLRTARVSGRQRAVRVIHGKGLNSPKGEAVLKPRVIDWLHHSDGVLAFCTAGFQFGAGGAVHVLLKRR